MQVADMPQILWCCGCGAMSASSAMKGTTNWNVSLSKSPGALRPTYPTPVH